MNEDYERNYSIGYIKGIAIGAVVTTAAIYGAIQVVKLGVDWAKAGIQEYKERKELKTNH